MKFLPFALGLSLSLLSALPARADKNIFVQQSSALMTGQGRIESEDDQTPQGRYIDTWVFSAAPGDYLKINVESADFAPVAMLYALNNGDPELVAANSETLNSLEVPIQEEETFFVVVSPYEGSTQGNYTIQIINETEQATTTEPSGTPATASNATATQEIWEQVERAREQNRVTSEYLWFSPTSPWLYP
ncbi:MAG: hypothetical protein AB8B99_07345 [Phormidesmis sp.]